jgi:hypothetical protein
MERKRATLEKFFVQHQGCNVPSQYCFQHAMYANPSEVVDMIKLSIREKTGKNVDTTRAIESGVVEEHAVVEKRDGRKILIFRVWPVFYTHRKRVEYKLYVKDSNLQEIILRYLNIFAKTNEAYLIEKD